MSKKTLFRGKRRKKAFALISVLMMMSLMVGLMTTMMLAARTESNASNRSARVAQAAVLSDMAVNLVMTQLTAGTTQQASAWASQPGAVWSYGVDGFSKGYKLYSDSTMRVSTEAEIADDAPPADWDSSANLLRYVDMNAPVVRGNSAYFPILDPRAAPVAEGGEDGYVDGFDFTAAGINGAIRARNQNARLPMPVEWLYVLRDGSYGFMNASGVYQPISGNAMDAATNPVTGRIAFWTDDESSKLNINTASEGTYWDTPRVATKTDKNGTDANGAGMSYTYSVPGIREYQRYPGHPASVSLEPAMQRWFPVSGVPHGASTSAQMASYSNDISKLYNFSPRVSFGSSKGGTIKNTNGAEAAYKNLTPDADRLFATQHEMIFQTAATVPATGRAGQELSVSGLNNLAGRVEMTTMGDFFLTTASRAPDTTVFETPRVAMFPQLASGGGNKGPMMQLLSFCSTIGGQPYYFQRKSAWANGASAQSSTADMTVTRNQDIVSYLRRLTARNIPGHGTSGNFRAKYGALGRDQLLTETLDFIRSGINITSHTDGTPAYTEHDKAYVMPLRIQAEDGSWTMGFGRNPTITEAALILYVSGVEGADTNGNKFIDPAEATYLKVKGALVFESYLVSPNYIHMPRMNVEVNFTRPFALGGGNMGFQNGSLNANIHPHYTSGQSRAVISGMYELLAQYRGNGDSYPLLGTGETRIAATQQTLSLTGGAMTVKMKDPSGNVYQTLNLSFPDTTVPTPTFDYEGLSPITGNPATEPGWFHWGSRISRSHTYNADPDPYNQAASYYGGMRDRLVRKGDVVRSVELLADGPSGGDVRMVAALSEVPASYFTTHQKYNDQTVREVHSLSSSEHGCADVWWGNEKEMSFDQIGYSAYNGLNVPSYASGSFTDNRVVFESPVPVGSPIDGFDPRTAPYVMRSSVTGTSLATPKAGFNQYGRAGDFDTGQGIIPDGCYIGKVDETNTGDTWSNWWTSGWYGTKEDDNTTFTPNRQVASPVKFGSLPTGISANNPKPWQTLLFCPNPPGRTTSANTMGVATDHFGFSNPPDHLWLDLFTMPVVEPWAISEPLSTAGRVNMNTKIAPFSYIKRDTAVRGVLRSARLQAIIVKDGKRSSASDITYKVGTHQYETRYDIDAEKTMTGFTRRFAGQDGKGRRIFLTPSEICEVFLVPSRMSGASYGAGKATSSVTYANVNEWWNTPTNGAQDNHAGLTGDNIREEPYNRIYSLLTTKSNTFRVHYRVQALQQKRSMASGSNAFVVLAEQRGSTVIERFVDPTLSTIPDFATNTSETVNLSSYYRYRVVSQRRFQP